MSSPPDLEFRPPPNAVLAVAVSIYISMFMSQRNWMRPSIGLAVFTAVLRKGSIGQRGCSGNGLYSGYGAGLEGPQLERR